MRETRELGKIICRWWTSCASFDKLLTAVPVLAYCLRLAANCFLMESVGALVYFPLWSCFALGGSTCFQLASSIFCFVCQLQQLYGVYWWCLRSPRPILLHFSKSNLSQVLTEETSWAKSTHSRPNRWSASQRSASVSCLRQSWWFDEAMCLITHLLDCTF